MPQRTSHLSSLDLPDWGRALHRNRWRGPTIKITLSAAHCLLAPRCSRSASSIILRTQTRVFVAAQASDSNPCTFVSPCRTFQHAHDVVAAGGEIDVLDPAGYGTVTIAKASAFKGTAFPESRRRVATQSRSMPVRPTTSTCAGC
jgi:hypothetical protein